MNSIHPGNVLTTISDRRKRLAGATPAFEAVIETAQDYYPFGSLMPGRKYKAGEYRFGFNGQEKDDEITGVTGSHLDFGARIYDSRIGRWFSLDPLMKKYPDLTPYNFVANTPLQAKDIGGKEFVIIGNKEYRTKVTHLMRDLYNQSPTARQALIDIASSDKIFLIVQNEMRAVEDGNYYSSSKSKNAEGYIIFSFGESLKNLEPGNGRNGHELEQSPMTAFSHELGHMYDDLNGKLNSLPDIYDKKRNNLALDSDEPSAVKFENKIRGELGNNFRTDYRGFNVFNKKSIEAKSIYKESILVDDNYNLMQHTLNGAIKENIDKVFKPEKF